jgi:hypothetical protein
MKQDLTKLSDAELLQSVKRLVADERARLVTILRHLQEMDRRDLALKLGYPSLFEYCVKVLKLAEGETARRIQATRAASKYPLLYRALDRGLLSLTTVSQLAPHLRWNNYRRVIRDALGLNKRGIEALVATLAPTPDRPDRVKFLGTPVVVEAPSAPAPENDATPADENPQEPPREPSPFFQQPQRVFFSFTADERLLAAVERAKELLQNKYGKPEFEHVFFEAVGPWLTRQAIIRSNEARIFQQQDQPLDIAASTLPLKLRRGP